MNSILNQKQNLKIWSLLLIFAGWLLWSVLQAQSNSCISTTNGDLTETTTFGQINGTAQSTQCGVDLSLDYVIESGTVVTWSDAGTGLNGNMEIKSGGNFSLLGSSTFNGFVKNAGELSLQAPQTPPTPTVPTSPFYTISNISGNTAEDGTTATFDVVLNSVPPSDVTVTLTSTNASEAIVSPSILTFTSLNWNAPQTITATGQDDTISDSHQSYQIQLSGVDPASTNTETVDVSLYNEDDDFPLLPLITINGNLINSGQLTLKNGELYLVGNSLFTGGNLDVAGSSVILSDNFSKTAGTITSQTATFKLAANASLSINDSLSIQTLELDGNELTLDFTGTQGTGNGFTVSNILQLNAVSENLNLGNSTLTLTEGVRLNNGRIQTNTGTLILGNTSDTTANGILDVQGGILELNAALNAKGVLKIDAATTLTLNNNALDLTGGTGTGGILETNGNLVLDGLSFDEKSVIKLNADTTISSSTPLTIKTVDLGNFLLTLGSATSDLTITDGFTINYTGVNGLDSGLADLTMNGAVDVQSGYINSTGGNITFGAGSTASTFADNQTGLILLDSTFDLQTALNVSSLKLTGTNSQLVTNSNTLNIDKSLIIGGGPDFDFNDITLGDFASLNLSDDAVIQKTGDLLIPFVSTSGKVLTLKTGITKLTTDQYLAAEYDINGNLVGTGVGAILAQGANITIKEPLFLEQGQLLMAGGTLLLKKGGTIGSSGELELSNSILELEGPLTNSSGIMTTSASTLRLMNNIIFKQSGTIVFDTFESNGWALVLEGNTSSLTLGGNITLQPSVSATSNGFIEKYSDNSSVAEAIMDNRSHVIGIETNDASLIFSANLTLQASSVIQSTGGSISINGNAQLENGLIEIIAGNLNLNTATVKADGQIKMWENSTLNLQQNITVAGKMSLDNNSVVNLNSNIVDLSGGTLELSGSRNLDSFTTNQASTFHILSTTDIFRTDGASNTIGYLQMSNEDFSGKNTGSSVQMNVTDLDLTINGTAQLDQNSISMSNSNLVFINAFSASNSNISVNTGDLVLQAGMSLTGGRINLTAANFKPKGSIAFSDSVFQLDNVSSFILQGDVTYDKNDNTSIASLDLNGNSLTFGSNVATMTVDNNLNIGNGETLNISNSNLYLNNSLDINNGGLLISNSGDLSVSNTINVTSSELQKNGGRLILMQGGSVSGITGKLSLSAAELIPSAMLSVSGTLLMNNNSSLKLSSNFLDLSTGILDYGGGSLDLNYVTLGSGSTLKISADTEITHTNLLTIGDLYLAGNKLSLSQNSSGLMLPVAPIMNNAGSIIETQQGDLTIGQAMSLDSGSITSTSGTLTFSNGLSIAAAGTLDVTGSVLEMNTSLDVGDGTLSSDNSSILDLLNSVTITANKLLSFKKVFFNGFDLNFGSSNTHLSLSDMLTLNNNTLQTGDGSLTIAGALSISNLAKLNSTGGTLILKDGGSALAGTELSLANTTFNIQNDLLLSNATIKTNNTIFNVNGNSINLETNSILEIENLVNVSGIQLDSSSILRLVANAAINDDEIFNVGTLDLADFALTINDAMAGLNVNQLVTLDAATEKIISGQANLNLNAGLNISAGELSSSSGTIMLASLNTSTAGLLNFQGGVLELPSGATLTTGTTFSSNNTIIKLAGNLDVSGSWTSANDTISLTNNSQLSNNSALVLASLQTNNFDFVLANNTTDLTIQQAFTLPDQSTLTTNGADLIFSGTAVISTNATLDASAGTSGTLGGILEFQNGGNASGSIHAEIVTFKLGANYSITGILKTKSSTILDLGTANLDLSSGELWLGGNVNLDNVISNNTTLMQLNGENATVQRSSGFTVGDFKLNNSILTLGSATTDLTLDQSIFDPNYTSTLSLTGGVITQLADLFYLAAQVELNSGGSISSTGGEVKFLNGLALTGGSLDLLNSKLSVGKSWNKAGGVLTLNQVDFALLDHVSLTSDIALTIEELFLNDNTLVLDAPSFSVGNLLTLDHANEGISWDNTILNLNAGLQLDNNGLLLWKNPNKFSANSISMNGGRLFIGESSGSSPPQTFNLAADIVIQANSEIQLNNANILNYTGNDISLNNLLTLSGNGKIQSSGPINLNGSNGQLHLKGVEIGTITASTDNLGIILDNSSTISNLTLSGLTPLSIVSGQNLSGNIFLETGGSLKITGLGGIDSNITANGGNIDVDQATIFNGILTQSANTIVDVAAGKSFRYGQPEWKIGSNQLNLKGNGSIFFPDNETGFHLDDANSLLSIEGNGSLDAIKIGAIFNTNKGLNITGTPTIGRLILVNDMTLSVQNQITVQEIISVENIILKLQGPGTFNADLSLKNSTLEIESSLTLAGDLKHKQSSILQIPVGVVLTHNGSMPMEITEFNGIGQEFSITGSGTLENSQPILLSDNASKIKFTGTNTVNKLTLSSFPSSGAGLIIQSSGTGSTIKTLNLDSNTKINFDLGSKLTLLNPLNIQYGLNINGTGTMKMDTVSSNAPINVTDTVLDVSGSVVSLGADLMISGNGNLTTDTSTTLSLTANSTLSSNQALTLKSLNLADKSLVLVGISILTINDALTLNGNDELQSSSTDLVFDGILNVANGGLVRNSGNLTLNSGGTFGNGINLDNMSFSIGGNTSLSGTLYTDINTQFNLNGNTLSFSNADLYVDGSLDLTGTSFDSQSNLLLKSDTVLINDSLLNLNSLKLSGNTLTLQSNTTNLSITDDFILDTSSEKILKNDADLTFLGQLQLVSGQLISTGGKLSLLGGIEVLSSSQNGTPVLDFSDTSVELSGSFSADNASLTTTNSSLKLMSNSSLSRKGTLEIPTLETNGYILDLMAADNNSSLVKTHLIIKQPLNLPSNISSSPFHGINVADQNITIQDVAALNSGGIKAEGGTLDFQKAVTSTTGEIQAMQSNITFQAGADFYDLRLDNSTLIINQDVSVSHQLISEGTESTFQFNGNVIDLTGANTILELGTNLDLNQINTSSNTQLNLNSNANLTRGSPFTLKTVNLNNNALSLDSVTGALTVTGNIIFDTANSQLQTNGADLKLEPALALMNGKLLSTGGIITLENGGVFENGATFNISGTTLALSGNLNLKSGTIITDNFSNVQLQTASSFESTANFTLPSLDLNGQSLTLNSNTTHLTLNNAFSIQAPETVNTQTGSLTFMGAVSLTNAGKIESSAGDIDFNDDLILSGATLTFNGGNLSITQGATITESEIQLFETSLNWSNDISLKDNSTLKLKNTVLSPNSAIIDLSGGTLEFGGIYNDFNSIKTDNTTSYQLIANASITRSSAFEIGVLELNNYQLTLGSANTDLSIIAPFIIQNNNSKLMTGDADLTLPHNLQLDTGQITSTSGKISLLQGGTLGTNGTLDVNGSTLELHANFTAKNGTLTTSDTSELHLKNNLTLDFNGIKTFKKLDHNDWVLTLGSSETNLELIDALVFNADTLHTQTGSLTLRNSLTMDNHSLIDSTGGTLTFGGSVDNTSSLVLPDTDLKLQNDLSFSGTFTAGAGTTITPANFQLTFKGALLELDGTLNLAGATTDNETQLSLKSNSSIQNSKAIEVGSLELNNSELIISMDLSIREPLHFNNINQKLKTTTAGLYLDSPLKLNYGRLSSTGGVLSMASTVEVNAAGSLEVQNGTLELHDNLTVASGTVIFGAASNLSILDNLTISDNQALSLGNLILGNNDLNFVAADNAGLTIQSDVSQDNTSTLNMNGADLIFNKNVSINGRIEPSTGMVKFSNGGIVTGSINLKDSNLTLQNSYLAITGELETNAGTVFSGADWLNLSGGTLSVADSLNMDGVIFDNASKLKLIKNTTITRNSNLVVGFVELAGFELVLGSAETDLLIDNLAPNEGSKAGIFRMQAADLSWSSSADFSQIDIFSEGGILSLADGSTLSGTGNLHLSKASTLLLNGTFSQTGGSLSLDNSTLKLMGNFYNSTNNLVLTDANLELGKDAGISNINALTFKQLLLNKNLLSLNSPTPSLTLMEALVLDDENGRIEQNGAALYLNGGIQIDSGGVFRLTGTIETGTAAIKLNGGLLAVDNSTTMTSDMTHLSSSIIEISSGQKLSYTGSAINIGTATLNLKGGGDFENLNPVILNNVNSKLWLSGVSLNNVATSSSNLGIVVDNDSTVHTLSITNITPLSIADGYRLDGEIEIASVGSLKLKETGKLAASVLMSGGSMEMIKNMELSGNLTHITDFQLSILSGKTVNYTGTPINVGTHTFKISNGGTFDNADNITLDHADGLLLLENGVDVSNLKVSAASNNLKGLKINSTGSNIAKLHLSKSLNVDSTALWSVNELDVDGNLTLNNNNDLNVETLDLLNFSELSLATENINLSISQLMNLEASQILRSGGNNLTFNTGITLQTSSMLIAQGGTITGNLELNGGQFTMEEDTVFQNDLTQTADSTIQINSGKNLTYNGNIFELGASKLNLLGGGIFNNTSTNPLKLNHANSQLITGNINLGYIEVSSSSNTEKGILINDNITLSGLKLNDNLKLEVAAGKSLLLEQALTVPTQGIELSGSGFIDFGGDLTLNGDANLTSGQLSMDATGISIQMGANLNLSGGQLLTDNSTNLHLLSSSILTTGAEQVVGNFTIAENQQPMLSLGENTVLEIINKITIINLCPYSLPVQPKVQLKLIGGVQVDSTGELCLDGWQFGDIVLNGGLLQIDANTTIDDSSISLLASSTLKISDGTNLSYGNKSIKLNAYKLRIEGGGALILNSDFSNALLLDHEDSILEFSGTVPSNISHVKTIAGNELNSPEILLNGNGIIQNLIHDEYSDIVLDTNRTLTIEEIFEVLNGKQMSISGTNGKLILGANLMLSGDLKVNALNTTLEDGTLVLNGGKLKLEESATIASNLSIQDNSTIQIPTGLTLTHTGAAINIAANSLTFSGGGTFLNSNDIIFNEPTSTLELNSISLNKVQIPSKLLSGSLNVANNSTITIFNQTGSSIFKIEDGTSLSISSAFDIPSSETIELQGFNGILNLNDKLTLAGKLQFTGTNLSLENGTLELNGGQLDIDQATTINSNITLKDNSSIDVLSDIQLTYSGNAINLNEHSIEFSGGGIFENAADLIMNHAASQLKLNGIMKINKVKVDVDLSTGELAIVENTIIENLILNNSSRFNFAEGVQLTLPSLLHVPLNAEMNLLGGDNATLDLGNLLDLEGILNLNLNNLSLINGTLNLNGGHLAVNHDVTIVANITHSKDSSIKVFPDQRLTYLGAAANIGAMTLILSGGGQISNVNDFNLNDPASILKMEGITSISKVNISAIQTTGKLEIDNSTSIDTLGHSGSSRLLISSGQSLSIKNPIEILPSQFMNLIGTGNGTLNIQDQLKISGELKISSANNILDNGTIVLNGGILNAEQNVTVQSNLLNSADSTINVNADKTINYSGNSLEINAFQLMLSGGGYFNNSASLSLNHNASILKLNGILNLNEVAVVENLITGFVDVDEDVLIKKLVQSKSSRLDILSGKTVALNDELVIEDGLLLEMFGDGGGILSINDNMSIWGILKVNAPDTQLSNSNLIFNNGLLDVRENFKIFSTLLLNDNASIDIASGKELSIMQSIMIPQNHSLTLQGTGSGSLFLNDNITVAGTLLLNASNNIIKNGEISLNGGVLDVDQSVEISSNILISNDANIDIAPDKLLTYSGGLIEPGSFQLTFNGQGIFANSENSSIKLSANSLLILAGDITLNYVTVAESSSSGKGIKIQSSEVNIDYLKLLADLTLIYTAPNNQLSVSTLDLDQDVTISSENQNGIIYVTTLLQTKGSIPETYYVLTIQDLNVEIENAVDVNSKDQIVMLGSSTLNLIGGLIFNVEGSINFKGTVIGQIKLNGGVMCVLENTTFTGNILHLKNSTIYIAPKTELKYEGNLPLDVNAFTLSIQGGGRFNNWDNNSVRINEENGILKLADNSTSINHLMIDSSVNASTVELNVAATSSCLGDQVNDSLAQINVDHLKYEGHSTFNLKPQTALTLTNDVSVAAQKSMTISGDDGQFNFNSLIFNDGSQLTLDYAGKFIGQIIDFKNNNILNVNKSVDIQTNNNQWLNSEIKIDNAAFLNYSNTQWKTEGMVTKSGGSMTWDNVSWSLLDNTTLSSNQQLLVKSIQLNDHRLELLSDTSDLSINDAVILDHTEEQIHSGLADLIFKQNVELHDGHFSSTGGEILFEKPFVQTGGILELNASVLKPTDNFTKTSGTFTSAGTTLELNDNLTWLSDTKTNLGGLKLNDHTLILASKTSAMEVVSPLTLDAESERIISNGSEFSISSLLSVANGGIESDKGIIHLGGGLSQNGGLLKISNGFLKLNGDVAKIGGNIELDGSIIEIQNNLTLTSNNTISAKTLELQANTLTLGSETSDLYLTDNFSILNDTSYLNTIDADFNVLGKVQLSQGKIASNTGFITFNKGGSQTDSFHLELANSTFSIGGNYLKTGGLINALTATLRLEDNSTITSNDTLEFYRLDLNDLALTLGSVNSDLKLLSILAIDHPNEWLITQDADLTLMELLHISDGGLTSSGGVITFAKGGQLSGSGTLDLGSSLWKLEQDFEKSSGTLLSSSATLKLERDLTFSSNQPFSFSNLLLNDFMLTLGNDTSDLTIYGNLTIDNQNEGIMSGLADLVLMSPLNMSNGLLNSYGGTVKLANGQSSQFSGYSVLMLANTLLTSDDSNIAAILEIMGEPDLSMTDSSSVSNITLTTATGTAGSISTAGGVNCVSNCTGFVENWAYGFNIHGIFKDVTSANWMLAEAYGPQKTATMKIKLLSRPTSDVQINLISSDHSEATLSQYALSFTPLTWNRTQTITINGEDDTIVDGDVRVKIIGYTDSTDLNYGSSSNSNSHAFKYVFTNIDDDIQKGLSPVVQIAKDQKINANIRVALDGSSSYDPDPNGNIVAYKWNYVGSRSDVVLENDTSGIANFTAPDVNDITVLIFSLEVLDNDQTAGYGSTLVTVIPIVSLGAISSVPNAINPKIPKGLTFDYNVTNSDNSKTYKLVTGSNELKLDMNVDGTLIGTMTNDEGAESKVNVPLGAQVNVNKDATINVSMNLAGGVAFSANIDSDGSSVVGMSKSSKSTNIKAPSGSTIAIAEDGTSQISYPEKTNISGQLTQLLSTLNPDSSTTTEVTVTQTNSRSNMASTQSNTKKSSLNTDPGLAVVLNVDDSVSANMAINGGTLGAKVTNDGESSFSYEQGTSKTTFSSTNNMTIQFKSDQVASTLDAFTAADGINRTITGKLTTSNITATLQSSTQLSSLQAPVGANVSVSTGNTISSIYAPSSTKTSTVFLNNEGQIKPVITTVATNEKQILPAGNAGSSVTQESGKIIMTMPLNASGSSNRKQEIDNKLSSTRFTRNSQRSGVVSEYENTGQWVGVDNSNGQPVFVESASSGATLVIENAYDNTSSVRLSSGTANLRIGNSTPSALSGTITVSNAPASILMSGSRNLVSFPAHVSVQPADFYSQFSAYKIIWVRRNGAWQFYTSAEDKTAYTNKGYQELDSTLEAGEGFWVELNAPINPTKLEVPDYGGYKTLTQLSRLNSEWNMAGTSKTVTVEEIVQAANFDQNAEDDTNTLAMLDDTGNTPPFNFIGTTNLLFENEIFNQTYRNKLFMILCFLTLLTFFFYRKIFLSANKQTINHSKQSVIYLGIGSILLVLVVACGSPQSDFSSSSYEYSGTYDRVHSLWRWDDENSKWLAYSPKTSIATELAKNYTTFSTVSKGQGFWVRLSLNGVPTSLSQTEPPAF